MVFFPLEIFSLTGRPGLRAILLIEKHGFRKRILRLLLRLWRVLSDTSNFFPGSQYFFNGNLFFDEKVVVESV
jgi:hypothetical protein